jgi:alkanesulfonate monooxygenase SsuD/methylene tetrahydromethanopterin reductase-like flavin-dependent oxidoreductase (luciferase family)
VGSPGTVHAGLADFIAATGVDELIVSSAIHDHAARMV